VRATLTQAKQSKRASSWRDDLASSPQAWITVDRSVQQQFPILAETIAPMMARKNQSLEFQCTKQNGHQLKPTEDDDSSNYEVVKGAAEGVEAIDGGSGARVLVLDVNAVDAEVQEKEKQDENQPAHACMPERSHFLANPEVGSHKNHQRDAREDEEGNRSAFPARVAAVVGHGNSLQVRSETIERGSVLNDG
jgi:hypothetical protein